MKTAARLTGFGVALVAVLTGAYGVGAALRSPTEAAPVDAHADSGGAGHRGSDDAGETLAEVLGGLATADRGYALDLDTNRLPGGSAVSLGFAIRGADGRLLHSYEVEHEKELHLIAVRRDFAGYQHAHPTRDQTGRWSTQLDLMPGSWRLFADFVPGDGGAPEGLTVGADLEVAGSYEPAPTTPVSTESTVAAYRVSLDGAPRAGAQTELAFTVEVNGRRIETEPYLGALGHLVALREGDLAYLHVHPRADSLSFAATFPTPGRYRLFLDLKVNGEVWTAPFAVQVEA